MYKKILSSVLAIGIALTMSSQALADPLTDKLNSTTDQYNQNQNNLSDAQKKASQLEADIENLDNQIQKNMAEVDGLKTKISSTESNIAETQKSIQSSEDEIKSEKELYDARMKAMYINGIGGYIDVLFDSKNLGDFLSKAEVVQKVTEADSKIINLLNQQEKELQDKKDALAKDKENLLVMQSDSNKKISDLNQKQAAEKPLVAQAQSQVNQFTNLTASQKAAIDAINKQIGDAKAAQAAQQTVQVSQQTSVNNGQALPNNKHTPAPTPQPTPKPTPKPTPGPQPTPVPVPNTSSLISFAESFQGVPYVWGGATPSGFDCSGFTSYVFNHFGKNLPRTSEAQWNVGTAVSESNLQPGDLVFFEMAPGGPGHVGIYIGNGLMIHAPHTGSSVQIIPFTDNWGYCGARRVG